MNFGLEILFLLIVLGALVYGVLCVAFRALVMACRGVILNTAEDIDVLQARREAEYENYIRDCYPERFGHD